ncbi:MAG: hypothetical protein IAE66_06310 [Xanthomonadaceae bacterium]|nr:hypothetical protein [Xanthomonadaceae bacterium]
MLATASSAAAGLGFLILIAVLFGIVLSILWILVPFAIFGIKPLLRQLIAEKQRSNALLAQLASALPPPAPQIPDFRDPRQGVFGRKE